MSLSTKLTTSAGRWLLVGNRRRLFSFGFGNEATDWIMMPFLIRLFPSQDIAPPLLLSIIQYLTRGDFAEFRRSDDCVISCDTPIWAYSAGALMQTWEWNISSRRPFSSPSLLKGPAHLLVCINYSRLVLSLIWFWRKYHVSLSVHQK